MKSKKKSTNPSQFRKRRSRNRVKRQTLSAVKEEIVKKEQPKKDQLPKTSPKNQRKQPSKETPHLIHEVDKADISDQLTKKYEFHQRINHKKNQRNKKTKYMKVLKACLFLIILLIIGVFFFYAYLFDMASVETNEMNDTLQKGEKVLYRKTDIQRFNIVKITHDGQDKWLRVVGVPGDTLEMENDTLYVNGLEYDEPYLKNNYLDFKLDKKNIAKNYTKSFNMTDFDTTQSGLKEVPSGFYVLLSDDRQQEVDSRFIGMVDESDIDGTANFIIWPPSSIGIIK